VCPALSPAHRVRPRGVSSQTPTDHREDGVKGAQKPKRDGKKPAQKTLKEKRQEKRNAAAKGTSGLH
jgi:hypothetical protein